jgi:hypothetical protein
LNEKSGNGNSSTKTAAHSVDWKSLIKKAQDKRLEPVNAETPRRVMGGASGAVEITCDDGKNYFVKGSQLGRAVVTEQIVAHLAIALKAPVPIPRLVHISPTLKQMNASLLGHVQPGLAHGLMAADDASEEKVTDVRHCDVPENRSRYARLAVLYGWVHAQEDVQYFFNKTPPPLVHSFDHAFSFPGGSTGWTPESLQRAPAAALFAPILGGCKLTNEEQIAALKLLELTNEETIVQAVAAPPREWGITIEHAVAVAEFLSRGRAELLAARQQQP